jgi:tetratricopeptide (TPR) repeat protein
VAQPPAIPPPGNRATAMWATDGVKPEVRGAGASGPFVGKLSAIPDEPAFAGRVRIAPGDPAAFDSGRVRGPAIDDDDDVLPVRRGSRAGMWVLIMALLVMGGAAAVVYVFVLRPTDPQAGRVAKDAGATAVVAPPASGSVDAAAVAQAAAPDAAAVAPSPLAGPRGELAADVEPRLRTAAQALDGKADTASQALRAHLIAQLAQDLLDRSGLIASPDADNLRKESKQLVLDAATAAQRALRAGPDDPGANLAMAEVLRLQGKPARDIKRYLDTARARPDKDWAVDLALADALVLARDGKVDDARTAFAAIDQGDGKLETAGDVRARFHLALALAAQGKAAEARPLVDAILAAQPEHTGARALVGKLETLVTRTDPLPPEDHTEHPDGSGGTARTPGAGTPGTGRTTAPAPRPGPATPGPAPDVSGAGGGGGGDSYDRLLQRANAIADSNCGKAMDLYAKALELKPNGVEALVGLGYCQIDAKQFSSAFSKFRAALAVSPRYEPALRGIAETYQQQGRKEQAIEAYRHYLEVYPDSVAAKKQLERLGADAQAPSPPAPSGASGGAAPPGNAPASPPAPAPATPPPPPPSTPGAADSSGAGSGSG